MRFVIRDDDTNYHTEPSDLKSIFSDVWDRAPVTVATIPQVSPDADVAIPDTAEQPRSVCENGRLTSYIKDQIAAGHVEVALHGYDHRPYNERPEFVAGPNLRSRVQCGKRLLEDAFGTSVSVFVPPHVRLSNRGLRAVAAADLDIVRGYAPLPRELQPTPRYPLSYARIAWFVLNNTDTFRYPQPLDFGSHWELYSHRLSNDTPLSALTSGVDYIAQRDGVFCLSTHSSFLSKRGRDKLTSIVKYAAQYDPDFVTASEVFDHYS